MKLIFVFFEKYEMDKKRKENARLIESDRPMKEYSCFSISEILKKEKCSFDRVQRNNIRVSGKVRYKMNNKRKKNARLIESDEIIFLKNMKWIRKERKMLV